MSKRFSDAELNELEYPDETFGSIVAREIREECNRLTRLERERLFRIGFLVDPHPATPGRTF